MKHFSIVIYICVATVFINAAVFSQSSWQKYDSLRNVYIEKAEYDSALFYAEKAFKLVNEEFGSTDTLFADMLNGLVVAYSYSGDYDIAIKYGRKEKALREEILQLDHDKYYDCISWLAWLYFTTGQYTTLIDLYLETLANAEKYFGKNHPHYESNLDYLAGLYREKGKYDKALLLYKEAYQNTKVFHGEQHIAYGARLNNLAEIYLRIGNYEKSLPLFYKCLENAELNHGKDHSSYGVSLNNIAGVYLQMGKYYQALPLLEKSLINIEKNHGKEHSSYSTGLNNLAGLFLQTGQYERALPLYLQSLEITEKMMGKDDSSYGTALNNLAELYREIGQFEKALPLSLEAVENTKNNQGQNHPVYGERINNLAGIYLQIGQYDNALPLYIKSVGIAEKTLGKDHEVYGARLNNLALLYKHTGQYNKSLELYYEALANAEKSLGKKHQSYGVRLNNLAGLYFEIGKYEKALPLFKKALEITVNNRGKDHYSYGVSLNNVAEIYFKKGEYETALPMLIEALENTKQSLGENHALYGSRLANLAKLHRAMGNGDKALPLYDEAIQNSFYNISRAFTFLSENQKANYIKTISNFFEDSRSFLLDHSHRDPQTGAIAYNIELARKGMILQSGIQIRQSILNSGDSLALEKYDHWVLKRTNLANQYSLPQKERNYEIINNLEKEVEKLEGELARVSGTFQEGTKLGNVNWEHIQQALKPNEYVVEFSAFKYNGNIYSTDSIIYLALVLGYDIEYPKLIYLCEQSQLDSIISIPNLNDFSLVNLIYRGIGSSLSLTEGELEYGERLYNLIWKPISTFIDKGSTVYYVPSGNLHQVAFAAIPYANKKRLSDVYDLQQMLNSTALVRDVDKKVSNNESITLFGGIEYDIKEGCKTEESVINITAEKRAYFKNFYGNINWPYLPGTLSEVEKIADIAKKMNFSTNLFTGDDAYEERFKELGKKKSPGIVHIATHGFYFPLYESLSEIDEENISIFQKCENPLNRSGLLFAGANNTWRGEYFPNRDEDGILTAYEVSSVNLNNTHLVVLSACETGLGDIRGSEGVFGLQRAFKAAGAEYLLMSLWKVPDKETALFMKYFYNQLFAGKSIQEAFKQTQIFMKTKYSEEPYKWAAFVLIR